MKIAVVDYEVGNIFNLSRAFEFLGVEVTLTKDPKVIRSSDKLILPGVGAFQTGIGHLNQFGLAEELKAFYKTGKPMLGICLGMQLLFDQSIEDGTWSGLGLIPGQVKKFQSSVNKEYKVPHMCWNRVEFQGNRDKQINQAIVAEVQKDPFVYFVHSYYVETEKKNILLSCQYAGVDFAAGVQHENLIGYQFHPERSGPTGLNLLKVFLEN